jgi:hypothetical protein
LAKAAKAEDVVLTKLEEEGGEEEEEEEGVLTKMDRVRTPPCRLLSSCLSWLLSLHLLR